jgi:hypothetical protein
MYEDSQASREGGERDGVREREKVTFRGEDAHHLSMAIRRGCGGKCRVIIFIRRESYY